MLRDGSGALKLFGQFNGSTNYSGSEQSITVRPGMEIVASCDRFVASDDSISGTSNLCVLKIDYYRRRNGIYGTADYISSVETTIADGNSPNDVWEKFELRYFAPPKRSKLVWWPCLFNPNNQGGAVHLDNLDLHALLCSAIRFALLHTICRTNQSMDKTMSIFRPSWGRWAIIKLMESHDKST